MFDNIWNGIKTVISGGVKIAVGLGQAAWALLKFAIKAVVWVIAGVFTMAKAGAEYVWKTIKDFFKPKKVIVIPPKPLSGLKDFIDQKIKNGEVYEDEEVMELQKKCEEAEINNESLIVAEGEDENGETLLAEPTFFRADSLEEKIDDANKQNQIYSKRIKVA